MNNTKTIAIIGNGNLGTAIYNGLLNHHNKYSSENISLLGRGYFDTDPRAGILSEQVKPLKNFEAIILAVKPVDCISCLSLMKDKIHPDLMLISTVSGLSIDIQTRMLKLRHSHVAKTTLDTNVEQGLGTIVCCAENKAFNEVQEIFTPVSKKIVQKSGDGVINGVTIVGSGKAFFLKHIYMHMEKFPKDLFSENLMKLTINDPFIKEYIKVVKSACKKIFNDDSLVQISCEGTLEAIQKSCHSLEDILLEIERVATKGGSTETKINNFDSPEKVTEKFFTEGFSVVNKKVRSFKKNIYNDYKEWHKIMIQKSSVYHMPKKLW